MKVYSKLSCFIMLRLLLLIVILLFIQPVDRVRASVELTVTGTWEHEDRSFDPISAAKYLVELYKIEGPNSIYLASGNTDGTGNFSIELENHPGNVTIFVMILTACEADEILVGDSNSDIYCYESDHYPLTGNESSIELDPECAYGEDIIDAFWIKDDLQFAHDKYNPPGSFIAEWEYDWVQGSCFNTGTEHIKIAYDGAEDEPDMVLHEMGHNVMYNVYSTYPSSNYGQDGTHSMFRNETETVAWKEGWAHFWALAVTGDSEFYYPSYDVGIDVEDPTWITYGNPGGYPEYVSSEGDWVEGRVAGTLWDIYDSDDDGFDTYNGNFDQIWDAFTANDAENFAEFWQDLRNEVSSEYSAVRAILQNTIDYGDLLVAETDFQQSQDANGYIFVTVNITSIKADGQEIEGVEIRSYEAEMDYSSAGVEVKRVLGGDSPYDDPEVDIGATTTSFSQSVTENATTPLVARVYPSLTGCCLDEYEISLDFTSIIAGNSNISDGAGYTDSFRRGDVYETGKVDLDDAYVCAMIYLTKWTIDYEHVNAVNGASTIHNGDNGDIIELDDSYACAMYYLGKFDCYFNPVSKGLDSLESINTDTVKVLTGKPELSQDNNYLVPVIIEGIPAESAGLGAYGICLRYDPKYYSITDVLPGKKAFTLEPFFVNDKEKGELKLAGIHPDSPGATGDITVAWLVIRAEKGYTGPFSPDIEILQLVDGTAHDITVKEIDAKSIN
ncbi:MAG: hypothetical protein JW712_07785 [Dehalococcoidales bacterium]|nr:hypothetical protein [Dehalococcoidales bacterium]